MVAAPRRKRALHIGSPYCSWDPAGSSIRRIINTFVEANLYGIGFMAYGRDAGVVVYDSYWCVCLRWPLRYRMVCWPYLRLADLNLYFISAALRNYCTICAEHDGAPRTRPPGK